MSKYAEKRKIEPGLDSELKDLAILVELPSSFRQYQEKFSRATTKELADAGLSFTSAKDYDALGKIRNDALDKVIKSIQLQNPSFAAAFQFGGFVAEKMGGFTNPLAVKCGDLISKRFDQNNRDRGQIETIAAILKIPSEQLSVNGDSGANSGYILTDKEQKTRCFIKTFSDDPTLEAKGLIDPNEALVYKVLEYMDMGPKTKFLIKDLSSSKGKTSAGNFILTEDVCNPVREGERRHFFLDDSQFSDVYAEALKTKEANVELSALSLVNDLMLLSDTFGKNPKNYGFLVIEDDSERKTYKVSMIDHLPNTRNAEFPPMKFRLDNEPYSPRLSIQKRINSPNSSLRDEDVAIHKFANGSEGLIDKARKDFIQDLIRSDVTTRVSSLPDALAKAKSDIEDLIAQHGGSFIEGAKDRLDTYTQKIEANFAKFKEIESSRQSGFGLRK